MGAAPDTEDEDQARHEPFVVPELYDQFLEDPQAFGVGESAGFDAANYYYKFGPPTFDECNQKCDVCLTQFVNDGCGDMPDIPNEKCEESCTECMYMMVDVYACVRITGQHYAITTSTAMATTTTTTTACMPAYLRTRTRGCRHTRKSIGPSITTTRLDTSQTKK